jgi:hypothetical protein
MMTGECPGDAAAWKKIVARYQQPSRWRGIWQIVNSLVPYVALWCLIYFSLMVSWWLALPLAVLAGGFLVRLFIIPNYHLERCHQAEPLFQTVPPVTLFSSLKSLNLICFGGLVVGHAVAWELTQTFLAARFSGAERHRRRLAKVTVLENKL